MPQLRTKELSRDDYLAALAIGGDLVAAKPGLCIPPGSATR